MNKIGAIAIACGVLFLSSNSFAAGISSKEKTMRDNVIKCINNIQQPGATTSINGKTPLDVNYQAFGGAYKYCSSAANSTRKMITPASNQLEKWQVEYLELTEEYMAIPQSDKNKPYAVSMLKKMRDLNSPSKLYAGHAQSKIVVYRQMLAELDKLDALLPSIEYM